MKLDGYSKHTHSHTRRALAHPPARRPSHPHTHTHPGFGEKEGDSTGIHSLKIYIKNYINRRRRRRNEKEKKKKEKEKREKKKQQLSLYVLLTSEFTHNKFQKVC